jgi:hypothetical protein
MATALAIALATYLLVGFALGVRFHGLRGGVWIIVILITGFAWPLTLWALYLDHKRHLYRLAAAGELAPSANTSGALLPGRLTAKYPTTRKHTFWFRWCFGAHQDERKEVAQEFKSALTELLKAEKEEYGATLEQRLAVANARAKARAVLSRRIFAETSARAFADAGHPIKLER